MMHFLKKNSHLECCKLALMFQYFPLDSPLQGPASSSRLGVAYTKLFSRLIQVKHTHTSHPEGKRISQNAKIVFQEFTK